MSYNDGLHTMSDYELHIINLKDQSEHMIPYDSFIGMNSYLRMHPEFRYGHLYRIDVLMREDGKLVDISDCLVLQVDNAALLKYIFRDYVPKRKNDHGVDQRAKGTLRPNGTQGRDPERSDPEHGK